MAINQQQLNAGSFIPSTYIFDIGEIQEVDVTSPEFKELLVRLYQNINSMALALNIKDTGYYVNNEFVNSQQFFPNPSFNSSTSTAPTYRQVFRKVINFGALPNAETKSVAHGIPIPNPNQFTFTRIYGAASDSAGLSWIPLPYASPTLINNIELNVDQNNINITTGSNRSAYTVTYVIIEYLKS